MVSKSEENWGNDFFFFFFFFNFNLFLEFRIWVVWWEFPQSFRQRPYHVEHTSSRPITEVKQHWARLVLGWVTAWEHRVLLSLFFFFFYIYIIIRKKKKIACGFDFNFFTIIMEWIVWINIRLIILPFWELISLI